MRCGHCKRDDAGVTIEHVRSHGGSAAGQTFSTATAVLDRPAPNRRSRRDEINADIRRAAEAVPEGRYAVRGDDGEWKFYLVGKPTEGKWKGYTFVDIQAGDDAYPLRGLDAKLTVLLRIGADAAEAARAYGRELGRCGVCNKTLTNPDSRAAGIGPICAGKQGW